MHPTSAAAEAGFTLLELLISLTLLALLLPLVFGGFHLGARSWERVDAAAERQDMDLARTFLKRQIEASYPAFVSADGNPSRVDFSGLKESLDFIGPTPSAAGAAGRSRYVLRLLDRDGHRVLALSWRPEFRTPLALALSSSSPDIVLIDNVASLDIAYFGKDSKTTPPTWRGTWQSRTELPQLIRIDVTFTSGDRRHWPALIAAPMVSVDAACQYDPVSRSCRGRPS